MQRNRPAHDMSHSILLLHTDRGFSLIETLISIAIVATLSIALLSILDTQNKELGSISDKLAVKDLESFSQKILSSSKNCGCIMQGKHLNVSTLRWSNPEFLSLQAAFIDLNGCVPTGPPMVEVGKQIGSSPRVVPESIKIGQAQPLNRTLGEYAANLEIQFDQKKLLRSIKPISITLALKVDPASGAFMNCAVTGSFIPQCRIVRQVGPPPHYIAIARCNSDEYVMSGGGACEVPGSIVCAGASSG
ncbi:MAG: type II secretion system protein, partial [Proteobacteria bacterium]